MNPLIIYIGESARFDRDAVLRALHALPGIHSCREGTVGASLECHFDWNSDSTIVRLTEDLESISITGSGDASLKIALELQGRLSVPLRLVDSDYSFDVPLLGVSSIEQLRRMIDEAS